ncbi:unnamed protein product, partial [Amoebophrya sp. A25]|eukprot:GSA25T00007702001.1
MEVTRHTDLDVVALTERIVLFRSPWLLATHKECHRNNIDDLATFVKSLSIASAVKAATAASQVATSGGDKTPTAGAASKSETTEKQGQEQDRCFFQIFDLSGNSILKEYGAEKFGSRLLSFDYNSSSDHGPPALELILEFCLSLYWWLDLDPRNIAFVHFKD